MKLDENIITAMRKASGVTLGGDPEFFFLNKKNRVVSAETLIRDSVARSIHSTQKVINDGVQGELNFQASGCRDIMIGNIRECLAVCAGITKNKMKITHGPIVKFTDTEMNALSDKAKEFGCNPDFNVYNSGEPNIKEFCGADIPIRFSGGHIHIGCISAPIIKQKIKNDNGISFIKLLDRMVGIPLTSMLHNTDEKERRKYYGQAGDYRLPEYGIEYRTLSSTWIIHPAVTSLVLGLIKLATRYYELDQEQKIIELIDDETVQTIINNNNYKKAKIVTNKLKPLLLVKTNWKSPFAGDKKFVNMILDGLQKFGIEKVYGTDIYKNWAITIDKCGKWNYTTNSMIEDSKFDNGFIQSYTTTLLRLMELNGGLK